MLLVVPAIAQPADPKPPDPGKAPAAPAPEPGKDEKKRIDVFAEATRLIPGPAGNHECVWMGIRVVTLLWRDDLDTAFRHLDLYDRFGCPGEHVRASFRCLIRQGRIEPKSETVNARVEACWLNPNLPPTAQATQPPPGTSSQ